MTTDKTMHVFVEDDLGDYVIAESPADAALVWEELCEIPCPEDANWVALPDDFPFILVAESRDDEGITKPCADWAKERGRGWFCTANY